jgi:hypothetical protein
MASPLEIAEAVRDYLPPPNIVDAIQAAERGDETCPICVKPVAPDQAASLLVIEDGTRYHLRLAHRTCRPSQLEYIGNSGMGALLADTFAFGWHTLLRNAQPRAVLLWDNRTNFDEVSFDGEYEGWTGLEVDTWEGFEPATAELDELVLSRIQLDPPFTDGIVAIHRQDCLEVLQNGHQWHALPAQSDSWREQADRDGEILLLNGTALRLDRYDAGHVNGRIAASKVLAGVIPFERDDRTAPREAEEIRKWFDTRRQHR